MILILKGLIFFVSLSFLCLFYCYFSLFEREVAIEVKLWMFASNGVFGVTYLFLHNLLGISISVWGWFAAVDIVLTNFVFCCVAFLVINFREDELYRVASVYLLQFYYFEAAMKELFFLVELEDEYEKIRIKKNMMEIKKTILISDKKIFSRITEAYEHFPRIEFVTYGKKVNVIARFPLREISIFEMFLLRVSFELFLTGKEIERLFDFVPPEKVWRWELVKWNTK